MDEEIKMLTREESLKYYNDNEYREEINVKYKKVLINFFLNQNIVDMKPLGSVHTLELSCCDNIVDVSALGSVHTTPCLSKNSTKLRQAMLASTTSCTSRSESGVTRVGSVHTLNLSKCKNIKDVSALGSVLKLDLSDCQNIIDVSALGSVHELNLHGCKKIKDIGNLFAVSIHFI